MVVLCVRVCGMRIEGGFMLIRNGNTTRFELLE